MSDRPLKIIVVSTPVFRTPVAGYSGLEVIAYELARGLAARGHSVGLVAPDGSTCPGVEVIQVGPERWVTEGKAYGGFPAIVQDGKELRPRHAGYWQYLLNADVVIDHSWNKYSYMLKAEGRLKAPVLGVMHAPVHTMLGSPPPVEKPCVVCISKDQALHYEALFGPQQARVAYNGIDLGFYRPMAGIKRTERFLFLARFSSVKSPDLAIEACLKAGVELDLVGDHSITNEPELFQRCLKLAGEAGTNPGGEPRIKVHGGVPRGQCVEWFSRAKALVHCTPNFREPFGLAPVEAMACGCPVMAWKYGAAKETVGAEPGGGWLVSSKEEMIRELKQLSRPNEVYWENARVRARRTAEQFSLDSMVEGYLNLCREALDGGW